MVWFLPMEEGTGVLRIRDLHSGIARTATTEGRSQAWATDGKHVAYFASKGWGPVSLHVLEVSTGYAEMIRESIVGCIRPVLSGDLIIWRHAESGQGSGKIFGYSISSNKTRVLVDASLAGVDPGWELWGGGTGWCSRVSTIVPPARTGRMLCDDGEYQEAVTDGNIVAWAAWGDGAAFVMTHDMETGADTRVAVPGNEVGTLGLRDGMLVFVGKARVADSKNGQDHTFA